MQTLGIGIIVGRRWRRATSSGRFSTSGRPCPTPSSSAPAATPSVVYRTTFDQRRAHPRFAPTAADLLRRHRPGQRHRGRHQRRRHSGHADRQPGQQRRLGDFRLLRRQRRLGGHPRPASQVRRRRAHRGDRARSERRFSPRSRGRQRRQRHRDPAARRRPWLLR